jgi:membrane protease YdiL (CAAX protease family)
MAENATLGREKITLIILALSLIVYTVAGYNYFMTPDQKSLAKVGSVLICFIFLQWVERSNKNENLKSVASGFFLVSLGFLASWSLRGVFGYINFPAGSVMEWAIEKLVEASPIIVVCLVGRRGRLSSMGLSGRDVSWSLLYGLAGCLLGFVQYLAMVGFRFPVKSTFMMMLPWMIVFSLSNSLMEELIFRGMFLRNYGELLGERYGLLLISLIFALFHAVLSPFMGTSMMAVFIVFLFFQGYVWGWIYQKTDSLWGSIFAHMVADVLFVLTAFMA